MTFFGPTPSVLVTKEIYKIMDIEVWDDMESQNGRKGMKDNRSVSIDCYCSAICLSYHGNCASQEGGRMQGWEAVC